MKNGLPRSLSRATLLILLASAGAQAAPVKAWQDTIQLPTYLEADAEPAPQFSAFSKDSACYPYPARSRLTGNRQDRTWQVLNLENEYLTCRVLPELGAHLYSCRDKRNGREMFYANPVIKKVLFGMRGAWVSLGIESNFPVAHARATVSPADYALQIESDGSARVVMEDVDRASGMQWRVDYVLRPASTVLEQHVTFYNRGVSARPYLWWANAAFTLDDPASRLVLPARMVAEHGNSRAEKWPIDSAGHDESLVSAHQQAMAWFASGCLEPFFAVYKPTFRSGLAHYADPAVVTGKKLWLWGSEQEKTVHPQVTDDFPFYGEIQAGLFQNQETYQFLGPEEYKSFSEYWMPVYDLGGISRVTRDAIVNMERRTSPAQSLLVEVNVTHPVAGAAIRLLNAGKVEFETRTSLDPATRFEHVVKSPAPSAYTIQVVDDSGAVLLEHTEGRYAAVSPEQQPPIKPEPAAAAGASEAESTILARARNDEMGERWAAAWSEYATGLRKFPSSMELRKEAGMLALGLNRFQDAAGLLAAVRAAAATDEVSYGYGTALAMLGRDREALEVLSRIRPSAPFGQAAALQLAVLNARGTDLNAALAALKPLLSSPGGRIRPGALEVALLRHAGRKEDALRQLATWLSQDPASSMLRFERILLAAADPALWNHLAADAERVLALADDYMSIGMYEDALRLLEYSYPALPAEQFEPGAVPPAKSPLVAYYRAWCRERLHRPAAADLTQAAHLPTTYAFPYLPHTAAVLDYALKSNPSDAAAHYLRGLYLMHGLQADEAVAEWTKARSLEGTPTGVNEQLARALQGSKELIAANAVVKNASSPLTLPAAPVAPKITHRAEAPAPPARAPGRAATPAPPPPPRMSADNLVTLASAAMVRSSSANGGAAFPAFDPSVFKDEKQPEEVRRAYIEVQLQKLIANSVVPGRCEAVLNDLATLGDEDKNLPFTFHGFGSFMKAAHFQYYLGIVEANCGDQKGSRRRWAKVSRMKESLPSVEFAFPFLAAARVKEGDAQSKATAALDAVRAALKGAGPATTPALVYLEGMLLHITGKDSEASLKLLDALQNAGNHALLQYLAQLGLREIQPAK